MRAVARSNGESLVQIKDNQKGLLRNARAMAKRGVANSQAFKEELQSDHALPLRMVVDAPSN